MQRNHDKLGDDVICFTISVQILYNNVDKEKQMDWFSVFKNYIDRRIIYNFRNAGFVILM